MDRRQKKTRAAIFQAFTGLLAKKSYNKITVQEIIDAADVGRTTFYAHFETKDDLLKELCSLLFGHIIDSARDASHTHGLIREEEGPESVFCHLLQHLKENDNNILQILSCESADLFLRYFKEDLSGLIKAQFYPDLHTGKNGLPLDFLVNHIAGSFVEMVLWWIRGGMRYEPEELDRYFRAVIEPVL